MERKRKSPMYRELLASLARDNRYVKPGPPCSEEEISLAEKAVGYPFPRELRALLREMNGDGYCLLSAKEIIENVERNRKYFLPLFEEDFGIDAYRERVDRFIFFATNGCGDYYGYRVSPEGVPDETAIYLWEHEELGEPCCWKRVAGDPAEFLSKYYQGEI